MVGWVSTEGRHRCGVRRGQRSGAEREEHGINSNNRCKAAAAGPPASLLMGAYVQRMGASAARG